MKDNATKAVNEKLEPVYDVYYRNRLTQGKWHRWASGPKVDRARCQEWIDGYNKAGTYAAGMVHIPMEKGMSTDFQIVKMERTIIEVQTRHD